jgi:hypothetical protein
MNIFNKNTKYNPQNDINFYCVGFLEHDIILEDNKHDDFCIAGVLQSLLKFVIWMQMYPVMSVLYILY